MFRLFDVFVLENHLHSFGDAQSYMNRLVCLIFAGDAPGSSLVQSCVHEQWFRGRSQNSFQRLGNNEQTMDVEVFQRARILKRFGLRL